MNLHNLEQRLAIVRELRDQRASTSQSRAERCHALAMLAKEAVFLAQDECELVDHDARLHAELRAYLNNARADLESLDIAIADRQLGRVR